MVNELKRLCPRAKVQRVKLSYLGQPERWIIIHDYPDEPRKFSARIFHVNF